jgi:hypothetical protein
MADQDIEYLDVVLNTGSLTSATGTAKLALIENK